MRRLVLALALALAAPSCGGEPKLARQELPAQWQDAFETEPDVLVVVRPRAIKRDKVFGRFFDLAMSQAQARGYLAGQTMIEAARGADEIVVGLDKGDDAIFVLRGVPASLDPGKVTDGAGRPLFRLVSEKSKVAEYQPNDVQDVERGTLFVLPDRTWVAATPPARERTRQAFATPFGRPVPKIDDRALAAARFGRGFVQRPRYQRSQLFGPLTRRLESVTLALRPENEGLLVALHYEHDDASAWAEMHAKRIFEEIASARVTRLEWLEAAKVDREGNEVRVRVPLPPRLLEELPNASGADISL